MMELKQYVKEISIEYLKTTPIGEGISKAMTDFEQYQESLYHLAADDDGATLKGLRIGTILTFSIIGKMLAGKNPKEFSKEDWKDILDNVSDYGINIDGQKYTEFIFSLIAAYIDISVELNKLVLSKESQAEISKLSKEIKVLSGQLESGKVKETDYVEKCLWISFEAMMKLLAGYGSRIIPDDYEKLVKSIADFAVQYARYSLYSKEQALLTEYLEHQDIVDAELEEKYQLYLKEIEDRANEFNRLLDAAFSDDFSTKLKGSVALAREVGVKEDEILTSIDMVDDFFIN